MKNVQLLNILSQEISNLRENYENKMGEPHKKLKDVFVVALEQLHVSTKGKRYSSSQ